MVSIIIAVYNGEKFLRKTIESALNQTVEKEIITVDDCSNDGSSNILKDYEKNSSIIVITNKINSGFCKSVNKGIKKASGEYILVLGQDDLLSSKHCEAMLKYFGKNTSMVFCDFDLMDENDRIYEKMNHCIHRNILIKDLYKRNPIPSVGLIMKTDKLLQVGGYPENKDYPQYGEYHTWIRMALAGDIIFCDDVRAMYRRHKANMTNGFNTKESRIMLNKYDVNCKKQLLNSSQVSFFDKLRIYSYIFGKILKTYLSN